MQNVSFNAAVGGFEYTSYQVADSAVDIGVLLELQYDGRDADETVILDALTVKRVTRSVPGATVL